MGTWMPNVGRICRLRVRRCAFLAAEHPVCLGSGRPEGRGLWATGRRGSTAVLPRGTCMGRRLRPVLCRPSRHKQHVRGRTRRRVDSPAMFAGRQPVQSHFSTDSTQHNSDFMPPCRLRPCSIHSRAALAESPTKAAPQTAESASSPHQPQSHESSCTPASGNLGASPESLGQEQS